MANTAVATGLKVQQYDDKFFVEYLGDNRFARYMGTGVGSMIQVKEDLTKKKGDRVTFALVNRLSGAGVSGSGTLEGNEEAMDSRSHAVTVQLHRNGVVVPEIDEQYSAIGLRMAARDVLMDWSMEHTRDLIITALGSINGVAYASATEGQKDAWLADNLDRVLFGAAKSNTSGTDHSASLANVDTTNDKLTPAAVSLMKRMANAAAPRIRPIRVEGDREYYVMFAGSNTFRDLKTNATITQAQREVTLANQNNRLFKGGDIEWDGVIIREIPEIPVYAGVGAGPSAVSPVYLCGAQALGAAFAKRWQSVTDDYDYGDKQGVAVKAIYGIEKLRFGSGSADTDDLKDHGVVTGYFSSVADT